MRNVFSARKLYGDEAGHSSTDRGSEWSDDNQHHVWNPLLCMVDPQDPFSACHSRGFACRGALQRSMRLTMTRHMLGSAPSKVAFLNSDHETSLRTAQRHSAKTRHSTPHLTRWHSPQTQSSSTDTDNTCLPEMGAPDPHAFHNVQFSSGKKQILKQKKHALGNMHFLVDPSSVSDFFRILKRPCFFDHPAQTMKKGPT